VTILRRSNAASVPREEIRAIHGPGHPWLKRRAGHPCPGALPRRLPLRRASMRLVECRAIRGPVGGRKGSAKTPLVCRGAVELPLVSPDPSHPHALGVGHQPVGLVGYAPARLRRASPLGRRDYPVACPLASGVASGRGFAAEKKPRALKGREAYSGLLRRWSRRARIPARAASCRSRAFVRSALLL
jgi:hypothetical protein